MQRPETVQETRGMYVYSALRHTTCRQKYRGDPKTKAETVTALISGSLKTDLGRKICARSHPDCTSGHEKLN